MATAHEVLEQLVGRLREHPEKHSGLDARFKFDLAGDGGGAYSLTLARDRVDFGEGDPAGGAQATIAMTAADFCDLVAGKLSGVQAFMAGKIRVGGDVGLAMRLESLLR